MSRKVSELDSYEMKLKGEKNDLVSAKVIQ